MRPPSAILQVTGLSPACTKFQSRLPKINKYAFRNRPHLPSPTPAISTHLLDVTSERFTRVLSGCALADSLSWYVHSRFPDALNFISRDRLVYPPLYRRELCPVEEDVHGAKDQPGQCLYDDLLWDKHYRCE